MDYALYTNHNDNQHDILSTILYTGFLSGYFKQSYPNLICFLDYPQPCESTF